MNIQQCKKISIKGYLAKLGHFPVKQRRNEFVYFSPFRSEKTPSFSLKENAGRDFEDIFFDFGENVGGSIIELMKKFFPHYDVSQILKELSGETINYTVPKQLQRIKEENPIKIRNTKTLQKQNLIEYILRRRIPLHIAKCHMKEIWYELDEKVYYSIGWKTESGYEMRNKIGDYDFKGCSGKKDLTIIEGSDEKVFIFESMFDYLSYLTLSPKKITKLSGKTIILNSTSLVKRVNLEGPKQIYTFMDNDKSGRKCNETLEEKYTISKQTFFHPYNDINEFLMNSKGISLEQEQVAKYHLLFL